MTLFSPEEEPVIPEPEDSSVKEVFSYFGLCMYEAQVLEQELINLMVGLSARDKTILKMGDFDNLFHEAGSKTLGQLIYDLRSLVEFPADLDKSLIEAKDNRNFVAHDFFKEHSIEFGVNRGREAMIKELINYVEGFDNVVSQVEVITDKVFRKLGITEEIVQEEYEKMKEESRAIDNAS